MLYDIGSHLGVGTVVVPTPPTEWCADVAELIEDYKETLSVYRLSATYDASALGSEVWNLQGNFQGDWQPWSTKLLRAEKGLSIKSVAFIIAGCNIDVEENDKVFRADLTFEYVNYVKEYIGHTTIFLKREQGSN